MTRNCITPSTLFVLPKLIIVVLVSTIAVSNVGIIQINLKLRSKPYMKIKESISIYSPPQTNCFDTCGKKVELVDY